VLVEDISIQLLLILGAFTHWMGKGG